MNDELLIVEIEPNLKARLKRKVDKYGNKSKIKRSTGITPHILRQATSTGSIRKGSLRAIVKWFVGPDANVEDYIKE